jgi:hypothetical protein
MANRWVTASALLLPLALSTISVTLTACGGGGSAPNNPSPSPSPPPSPPPPPATNTALPPTVTQTFSTLYVTSTARITTNTSPPNTPSNVATTQSSGSALSSAVTLTFNQANNSYQIQTTGAGIANENLTYTGTPTQTTLVNQYTLTDNGNATVLLLFRNNNSAAGSINLTSVSYGAWQREVGNTAPNAFDFRNTFFVYGIQTTASSMPTTGTATYNGLTDGYWISNTATTIGVNTLEGASQLSANFGNNTITGTLTLVGRPAGSPTAPTRAFGTVVLEGGTISGSGFTGNTRVNSTTNTSVNGMTGTFNGAFFGTVASGSPPEIGGTFRVTKSGGGEEAVGVFVGRR